jgi:hypothetical protein
VRSLFLSVVAFRVLLFIAEILFGLVSGYGYHYLTSVENLRVVAAHPFWGLADDEWDILCCARGRVRARTGTGKLERRGELGGGGATVGGQGGAGGGGGEEGGGGDGFPFGVQHALFARTDKEYEEQLAAVRSLSASPDDFDLDPRTSEGCPPHWWDNIAAVTGDDFFDRDSPSAGEAWDRAAAFSRAIGPCPDVSVEERRVREELGSLPLLPRWAVVEVPVSTWAAVRPLLLLWRRWQVLFGAVIPRSPLARVIWSRVARWWWLAR